MKYLTLLTLILFSLTVPNIVLAGKLDKARSNVNKSSKSRSSSSGRSIDLSDDANNVLGELALYILLSPFWGPYTGLNDSFSYDTYFHGAPYKHDKKGYLIIDRFVRHRFDSDGKLITPDSGKSKLFNTNGLANISLSLFTEDSYEFDDRINRLSWGAMLDTSSRIGLETTWTHFYEKLKTGSDSFIIFDANAVLRFAQNEYAQFYVGAGYRGLIDKAGDSGGFNSTYFVNIYAGKPVSFTISIDLGTLGEAFFLHHRSKLGVVLSSLEIYLGYDLMKIGNVVFFGPMFGLQLWL